jgi:hypothetical protein
VDTAAAHRSAAAALDIDVLDPGSVVPHNEGWRRSRLASDRIAIFVNAGPVRAGQAARRLVQQYSKANTLIEMEILIIICPRMAGCPNLSLEKNFGGGGWPKSELRIHCHP